MSDGFEMPRVAQRGSFSRPAYLRVAVSDEYQLVARDALAARSDEALKVGASSACRATFGADERSGEEADVAGWEAVRDDLHCVNMHS